MAAGQRELGGGVVPAGADEDLVLVEGTQRRGAARDRGAAEPVGAELGEVAFERLDAGRRRRRRRAEPGSEVSEVAPVRLDRARREPGRG